MPWPTTCSEVACDAAAERWYLHDGGAVAECATHRARAGTRPTLFLVAQDTSRVVADVYSAGEPALELHEWHVGALRVRELREARCDKHGTPLLCGWQITCELCDREYEEDCGCRCGGTGVNSTILCVLCGLDSTTILCAVCCPDD